MFYDKNDAVESKMGREMWCFTMGGHEGKICETVGAG